MTQHRRARPGFDLPFLPSRCWRAGDPLDKVVAANLHEQEISPMKSTHASAVQTAVLVIERWPSQPWIARACPGISNG
jgi:hypothetical protein